MPFQTDVFFIDRNGALNVSWVDGGGNWQGPVGISPAGIAPPVSSVAASAQFGLGDQTDVFFIDHNGALNVSWVDGGGNWQGPVGISAGGVAPPGGCVAASAQFGLDGQTDVFFIDQRGALNVAWVVNAGRWNGPVGISPPGLAPPGGCVAASAQFGLDGQTDVFVIDNNGALNVSWVVNAGQWNGPAAISPPGVAPAGSSVAASAQFGLDGQTDVFLIDHNGALNVSWVVNAGQWNGPAAVSGGSALPPTAVAASQQFGVEAPSPPPSGDDDGDEFGDDDGDDLGDDGGDGEGDEG
jgi:hypothetical protein